jgi:lipopolysaccharide transport system permease protein
LPIFATFNAKFRRILEKEHWTETISPSRGLFDLRLRELWRYRDLIALFVRRDFVSIYKQTLLGPLWLFLQPLLTTLIFTVIFNRIAKLPTNNLPPVLFYMAGITLWTYFADCFIKTSNVFVSNAGIFGKVYFPRLTTPVSIVISNLIKFGIQFGMLVCMYAYFVYTNVIAFQIHASILILPFLLMLMALMGLGMGIIFSSLTTKYRDLAFLLQFGVQLLMYATPVIYPLSSTGGKLKTLLSLNPITPVIETFRAVLFNGANVDFSGLGYCTIFTLLTLLTGTIMFNQVEKSFMDTV